MLGTVCGQERGDLPCVAHARLIRLTGCVPIPPMVTRVSLISSGFLPQVLVVHRVQHSRGLSILQARTTLFNIKHFSAGSLLPILRLHAGSK